MPRAKKTTKSKEPEKKVHRASICFYGGDDEEDPIAVRLEFDEDVIEDGDEPPVYKLSREMYVLVAEEIAGLMESLFGDPDEEEEEDARKTTRAKGNTTIN